ncbi:hypothetical protein [Aquisalinus flavus]|uniref:Uncharacterized protein n=1 Tax=Aquisalinus flavus TaxID=1526572 RepID=A0A8J2Y4Z1_9PROT|nr:hypothetical protein [Aquisalinus flavus]MBD0427947.1 hypothetical protein [Aquisalinus flavus]UNE47704.1 hypothetical protein FF099_06380 [Aquisalinus flavus]GGD05198.1 hypothetical protein GCM10011342_12650 [Aquisalinus flavus]
MSVLSGKTPGAATLAVAAGGLALFVLALVLILRPAPQGSQSYQVQLYPFLTEAGVEIGYRPVEPVESLTIGLSPDYLAALSVTMNGEIVRMAGEGDGIGFDGSEPFDLVSIVIDRSLETPAKAYPLVQYGTGAAVIDITPFQPVAVNGQRVSGQSPGPRFQWVGQPLLWEGENIVMLYEEAMPQAVQGMIGNSIAVLNDYYKGVLGGDLPARPELYMLYAAGQPGQIAIEGDSVRGQVLIRFIGGGLNEVGQEARRRVLENIAHEMAHLWQLERDGVGAAPDWLHEGGAQAIGLESLFITEQYADADYAAMLGRTQRTCANALAGGPLDRAAARGEHEASYACGVMAWTALSAQREGATVVATWKAFADFAAGRRDGQSAEAFYDFAAEWSGSEPFTRSLRQFVRADWSGANGRMIVDGLFEGSL